MMDPSDRPYPPVFVLLAVLLAAPLIAAPGKASEPEEPAFGEHVVVTATGSEVAADEVASTVTVLTRDELERKQQRSVPEALAQVPGVDVRRNGGVGTNTTVFLRGADSDHTLVLVDGIEVNDPSTPSRAAFLDHLTLDNVQRIEVLRGPQSTLYGSDAIGGVINIITERGGGDPVHRVWAEAGRYSTFRGGFESAGGGERFDYSVSASATDSDGFSASSGGTEDDPYENRSLAGRIGFDSGEGFGIDLILRHTDAETDFDGFGNELDHAVDARQTLFKLEPRLSLLDGKWRQRWGIRESRHERDTSGDSPGVAEGRVSALDWRNDVDLGERHALAFGLEGEWEKGEFGAFDDRARTVAAWVQDQLRLGRFFGTIGARFDDHDRFGSETTYRVALGYRLGPATVLRASQGTGFKAPSLLELNASAFGGNPDLAPENSSGFDVGLEHRWAGERAHVGVTLFHNDIDDLIVAVCDPVTFECLNFNVDEAETRGVESYVGFRPDERFEVRAHYTFTDSEAKGTPAGFGLTEGSRLLRRPEHKGGIDANRRFPGSGFDATLSLLFVGERDDLDPLTFATVEADEYLRLDLAASWTSASGLQVFGRLENLLDEDYEDVQGFGTPGRSAFVGVRLDF